MRAAEDLKTGEKLGRYRLLRELGRGSMGTVFLAEDTLLRQQLCLKVLHPALVNHGEAVERFSREILLARRIAHRGVCRLHDIHQEDGFRFITMEHVEGVPLRDLLGSDKPPIPVARALNIGRSICEALAAAHDVGVIHRDLKPRNIIIRDGSEAVLLDFGIATAIDFGSSLTIPGVALGTKHYIAPEVWAGRPATPKSDQFAVGVMLFNCLTHKMPFNVRDTQLFEEMRKGPPAPPSRVRPELPNVVDELVLRALAFNPDARFADARALAHALEEAEKAPLLDVDQRTAVVRSRAPQSIAVASDAPDADVAFARQEANRFDVDMRATEELPPLSSTDSAPTSSEPTLPPVTLSEPTLITIPPETGSSPGAGVMIEIPPTLPPTQPGTVTHEERPSRRPAPLRAVAAIAGVGLVATIAVIIWREPESAEVKVEALPSEATTRAASAATTRAVVVIEPDADTLAPVEAPQPPSRAQRAVQQREPQREHQREQLPRLSLLLKDLQKEMSAKGIRTGDDVEFDRLRAAALAHQKSGASSEARDALEAARARLAAIAIDRAFVERKLRRFNEQFDRVSDAQARAQLDRDGAIVLAEMSAGRYPSANRALNEAFAHLEKAQR